jgi:hypothetical protein
MMKFLTGLLLGLVAGMFLATNPVSRELGAYLAAMSLGTLL